MLDERNSFPPPRRASERATREPPRALPIMPHLPKLFDRLVPHIRVAVDVNKGDLRITRQTANTVAEPFPCDEDRAADVEPESVVLERRAVPVAHQEADQALVGVVQLRLAPRERDAGGICDGEVVCQHAVEADEAVIEDLDRVFGYRIAGHGTRTVARLPDVPSTR